MNADTLSRYINTLTSPEDTTNEVIYEGNSDKMNEYNDANKQRTLYEYTLTLRRTLRNRKLLNRFD